MLGMRPTLSHLSERLITALTRLKAEVNDASTGFRAISKSIAERIPLHGSCACGTFILEAHSLDARIEEVPITVGQRSDKRHIKTRHLKQILYVVYGLLKF